MNVFRKIAGILFFLQILTQVSQAQAIRYKIGYFGFMDNREYFNPYVNDQTIFGSRINAELGFAFDENKKVMAGIDYLYEFGSKGELIPPDITLYYNSKTRYLDFYLGAFPRLNLLNMPMALMIDTFQYYRPNIEGILLNYSGENFGHNIWIDWQGRQSYDTRERFMLGFSGHAKMGLFTYQHHAIMSHVAHTLDAPSDQHLEDNGGYAVLVGIDFSPVTGFDTLAFSTGYLGSYDRLRGVYDMQFASGWLTEAEIIYKGVGLRGTLYKGDSQKIISGDGFYKSTSYTRADVFYQVSKSNIQGRLQFSFHFLPGNLDPSMSLTVRAQLDGMFKIGPRQ
jgi:hypothetical protein